MRLYLCAALALACASAAADPGPCIENWPWQIPTTHERAVQYGHKALHTLGSAAVTMAVAKATDSVEWGIAAGITAGVIREFYKVRSPGMRCEISSMTFDLAGVALGAYASKRWLLTPRPDGGAQLTYTREF